LAIGFLGSLRQLSRLAQVPNEGRLKASFRHGWTLEKRARLLSPDYFLNSLPEMNNSEKTF
jgi:hypothetical protein